MDALHIQRFEARYHLSREQLDMHQRLDGLLADLLPQALETVLESSGVSPHEEICLRQIHVPVRLRMSASDPVLISAWCEALAEAIRSSMDNGQSDQVVRYSSRINALADFAMGVANRCYPRAWAWNQLGLARLSIHPPDSDTLTQFMEAMMAHPQAIVPVLRILAQQNRLHTLAPRLEKTDWQRLAQAAIVAAGGKTSSIPAAPSPANKRPPSNETHEGNQVLAASILAGCVIRLAGYFAGLNETRPALTALITLEVQPELFRLDSETILARLHTIDAALTAALFPDSARRRHSDQDKAQPVASTSRFTDPKSDISPLQSDREETENIHLNKPGENEPSNFRPGRIESDRAPVTAWRLDRDPSIADPVNHTTTPQNRTGDSKTLPQNIANTSTPPQDVPPHFDQDYPRPETLVLGCTAYGGLLFLLPLVEGLGLVEALPADPRFKHRSLRWILHALARRLTRCDERDPAALAFCGFAPDVELPWQDKTGMDSEEAEALDATIELLAETVAQRLGENTSPSDRLLDFVCHRRARIQADPGWIECVLSMEEVSTAIRRGGLDLDPGYLPWLGVVLVFRYE